MFFNHGKVKCICLFCAVVLLIYTVALCVNDPRAHVSYILQNVTTLAEKQSRKEHTCRTDIHYINALKHGLNDSLTSTTLENMFGDCVNTTDISNESLSLVFKSQIFKNVDCQPLKISFLETRKSKIVLASFPGSGNTWTRHLLEQLTGIWTGSVYNDSILARVFLGEPLRPNSNKTFIVKSHLQTSMLITPTKDSVKTDSGSVRSFDGAILLLRNPYDALLAEFNRIHGGHMAMAGRQLVLEDTKGWQKYVFREAAKWKKHVEFWLTKYEGPVHVLFYENLKTSLAYELYRLSTFLHMTVSYKTLWCTMQRGRGQFHREKKPEWMTRSNLYTTDMQRAVDTQIDDVETALRSKNVPHKVYNENTGNL